MPTDKENEGPVSNDQNILSGCYDRNWKKRKKWKRTLSSAARIKNVNDAEKFWK